ncbi:ABC transporter substrate-binding protein [Actinacidiphila yeochonensis]|uniref:ABC transporter substrate-binding protein n=1 Tax=Actinacidiphila yeochonensis TaxID=89050 RepID=UPI000560CCDD|nr:ABC transporter substrate-binding protein [Actinacidiphila yeochonensis]
MPTPLRRAATAAGAALLAVVLSATAGCTATSSTAGTAADTSAEPVDGGNATYAINVEPSCLDPHVSPADATAVIQRGVFDSLVEEDAKGIPHPWLARSWKIGDGGRTYDFTLRDDVSFHDGTHLDAAAVKANFDHITAPATKSQYAASLFGPDYKGTTVTGRYTLRVSFGSPFSPFLQGVSTTYLGIESPKALAAGQSALCAAGTHSVGTGPFKETSRTVGRQLVLSRNPAYRWGPQDGGPTGPAHLSTLTIRFLTDDTTRVGTLTSGQIDAAVLPVTAAASVRANPQLQLLSHQAPGEVYSFQLNTVRGPLEDQRVRLALLHSLDIGGLVKAVYLGVYQRAWSPLSPSTPNSYDAALENTWTYDPKQAGSLLDQAGWTGRDAQGYRTKDGRRLTLVWPTVAAASVRDERGALADGFQAQAKAVGIQLKQVVTDEGTYYKDAYTSDYDILDVSWARGDGDILRGFYLGGANPEHGGQNAARTDDPQVNSWLLAAASTTDPAQRRADYAKVQQWVIDHAVTVPVYVGSYLVGASKSLHGITFDVSGWPLFARAWTTRR